MKEWIGIQRLQKEIFIICLKHTINLNVDFYRINSNLSIDYDDLGSKITGKTKLLMVIDYFGFPGIPRLDSENSKLGGRILRGALDDNVFILEDCTHSLLSQRIPILGLNHIRFASYRKLLPVPNGGFVECPDKSQLQFADFKCRISLQSIGSITYRCIGSLFKCFRIFGKYLVPKCIFRRLLENSEVLLEAYAKPAGLAPISKYLLDRIDVGEIINARRTNFQILLDELMISENVRPLYTSLPDEVCPLGFPLITNGRDKLVGYLIANGVYPPVHWPLPPIVDRDKFRDSWDVSKHILTIPIDHRYDAADMSRIASLVNQYAKEMK